MKKWARKPGEEPSAAETRKSVSPLPLDDETPKRKSKKLQEIEAQEEVEEDAFEEEEEEVVAKDIEWTLEGESNRMNRLN